MFNVQRMQQIDGNETKTRNMGYEIEVIKMNLESAAKLKDINELSKKLGEYAPLHSLRDM